MPCMMAGLDCEVACLLMFVVVSLFWMILIGLNDSLLLCFWFVGEWIRMDIVFSDGGFFFLNWMSLSPYLISSMKYSGILE